MSTIHRAPTPTPNATASRCVSLANTSTPSTPAAIADTIEWLDPWVPWVWCLLEDVPDESDPRERGVVVTFGSPAAVAVAIGTQSTLAV